VHCSHHSSAERRSARGGCCACSRRCFEMDEKDALIAQLRREKAEMSEQLTALHQQLSALMQQQARLTELMTQQLLLQQQQQQQQQQAMSPAAASSVIPPSSANVVESELSSQSNVVSCNPRDVPSARSISSPHTSPPNASCDLALHLSGDELDGRKVVVDPSVLTENLYTASHSPELVG